MLAFFATRPDPERPTARVRQFASGQPGRRVREIVLSPLTERDNTGQVANLIGALDIEWATRTSTNCHFRAGFFWTFPRNSPRSLAPTTKGINPLAGAFSELVHMAKTDVVVIIDEAQHAMGSEDGDTMLLALKATRDEIK